MIQIMGKSARFGFMMKIERKMSHYYSGKPAGYGTYVPGDSDPNGTADNGLYAQATLYYYDAAGNEGNSVGTGIANDFAHRFSPVGQGFMILAASTGDGKIILKNSHRRFIKESLATHSVFHRPSDSNSFSANDNTETNGDASFSTNDSRPDTRLPQMRLFVSFNEDATHDLLLAFSDQATDGYDRGFDGLSPSGTKILMFIFRYPPIWIPIFYLMLFQLLTMIMENKYLSHLNLIQTNKI